MFRLFVLSGVPTALLFGCASGPVNWTHQATYHALFAASQYQEQLKVVVAKMTLSGLSFKQVEEQVAIPLERSVASLAGISAMRTQSTDGRFVMEVHFEKGAGEAELAQMEQVVNGFLSTSSLAASSTTVTIQSPP